MAPSGAAKCHKQAHNYILVPCTEFYQYLASSIATRPALPTCLHGAAPALKAHLRLGRAVISTRVRIWHIYAAYQLIEHASALSKVTKAPLLRAASRRRTRLPPHNAHQRSARAHSARSEGLRCCARATAHKCDVLASPQAHRCEAQCFSCSPIWLLRNQARRSPPPLLRVALR